MSDDGGTSFANRDQLPRRSSHSIPHSAPSKNRVPEAGPSHKPMRPSLPEYPDSKQSIQARELSVASLKRGPTQDATQKAEMEVENDFKLLSTSKYTLKVRQQPERARLCSYKEENDTIDRRPVDPPPVVEMRSGTVEMSDLLESTNFFIRASLVQAQPESTDPSYPPVYTPTGQDAASGDVIQTPERLKLLDGRQAALCVFARLSVRLPGIFRLKFTLYETTDDGVCEVANTTTEPFEVFSPKLFTGMAGSTPLTRHLAAQGLKVKLRPDTVKQSSARRKATARTPASAAMSSVKAKSPVLEHPGRLVWRSSSHEMSRSTPSPFDWGSTRRTGDDGMFPSFRAISGQMDWMPMAPPSTDRYETPSFPSSTPSMQLPSLDLRQFSLGFSSGAGSRARYGQPDHAPGHNFMPAPLPHPLSLQNRTSSTRSEGLSNQFNHQSYGERTGDTGLPMLPPILTHHISGSSAPNYLPSNSSSSLPSTSTTPKPKILTGLSRDPIVYASKIDDLDPREQSSSSTPTSSSSSKPILPPIVLPPSRDP